MELTELLEFTEAALDWVMSCLGRPLPPPPPPPPPPILNDTLDVVAVSLSPSAA